MPVKIAGALLCFLLSFVSLLGIIDSSGVLQDAPPSHEQLAYVHPFQAGFVVFGLAGVALLVRRFRSKRSPANDRPE